MADALSLLNDIPVDRMAASMFFKTPYWAEYIPDTVKKEVEKITPNSGFINVDYFRLPPDNSGKPPDSKIRNRIGETAISPNGTPVIVTGYAYSKAETNQSARTKKNKQGQKVERTSTKRMHLWWILSDGEYFTIRSKRLNEWQKAMKVNQ